MHLQEGKAEGWLPRNVLIVEPGLGPRFGDVSGHDIRPFWVWQLTIQNFHRLRRSSREGSELVLGSR